MAAPVEQPAPDSRAAVLCVGDGGGRWVVMALDGRGFSVSHAPVAVCLGRDDGGGVSDSLAFGAVGGVISCYPSPLTRGRATGKGGRLVVGPPSCLSREGDGDGVTVTVSHSTVAI